MKTKVSRYITVAIESINYIIIISYALSNMELFFHHDLLYILFFASEIYVMASYWKRILQETKSKAVSAVLLLSCFSIHIGMVYFIGYVSGSLVPFKRS